MNRRRHWTGPNPEVGKRSVGRRRVRVRWLPCLIAALALATPAALISRPQPTTAATPAVADGRPNIVFISTDDMRVADLPAMPNVRNLIAARGTNFTTSYIPFPLCCPSRAAWLTGQYNHNNGVMGNLSSDSPVGGYPALDNTNTLATWLREGGYQTAYVGRYLHGYGGKVVPPGWQEWHAVVGHNDWFNPLMRENATGTLASTTYTGQYLTDKIDTTSNTVIRDRVPGVAPFFLWVSHFAPHAATLPTEPDDPRFSSPVVPPRYKDLYANTPVPADPSYKRGRCHRQAGLRPQSRAVQCRRPGRHPGAERAAVGVAQGSRRLGAQHRQHADRHGRAQQHRHRVQQRQRLHDGRASAAGRQDRAL